MTVAEDILCINVPIAMKSEKLVMGVEADYVPNAVSTILISGRKISVERCSMYHIGISFLVVLQRFGMFSYIEEISGKS